LPFVKKVVLNKRSVYIEKLNILEWNDVKNELCKQIQDFLNEGGLVSQVESNKVSPTTVYAESTPNPNVMKFVVNKKIVKGVYEFKNVDETSNAPIVKSLFTFPFVKEVFLDFNFISITQNSTSNWDENVMEVREFIRKYVEEGKLILKELPKEKVSSEDKKVSENLDPTEAQIVSILDEYIKPAVASDGGNIQFDSYNEIDKTVQVILQGACSGCPSSTFTLKNGIENMLKEMMPGKIEGVIALNG
jgi:Fe-S cluster biogenesis protein NfuA